MSLLPKRFGLCFLSLIVPAVSRGGTHDLLELGARPCLVALADVGPEINVEVLPGETSLRFSHKANDLRGFLLSCHFNRSGPVRPGDNSGPDVVLASVGDSVGVRAVVSFNQDACRNLDFDFFRMAVGHSGGTRPTQPIKALKAGAFEDDRAWGAFFVEGNRPSVFWERPVGGPETATVHPCRVAFGKTVGTWKQNLASQIIKPDKRFEAVFSLTRTGASSLSLYAFVNGVESTQVIQEAKAFNFDAVHLGYPFGRPGPGAAITFHELQLRLP